MREKINSFVTQIELCKWSRSTHSLGIAGTEKVVGDWLEVGLVAVFVPPDRQAGLPLRRRLLSAVVSRSPSDNRSSPTHQPLLWRLRLRQAHRYHILRLPHRLLQHHDWKFPIKFRKFPIQLKYFLTGNVIVESDARESRMRSNILHFECNRRWRLVVGR